MSTVGPDSTVDIRFDRGTVLVRGPAVVLSTLQDQGLVWDARVGAHRALASSYPEVARAAHARAATVRDAVKARQDRLDLAPPGSPVLRPYQADALAAWEVAGRRGVVCLPTGAGKTHVALAAVARVRRPAIVLVPTRVLLEQWVRQARDTLGVDPAVFGDGEHRLGPLTICTFESAFRHMDEFGDRFPLLVVDEVHHFAGGMQAEALEMCAAEARLGLSATPPSTPDASARLAEVVGPVVFHLGVRDLAGTHLAPFQHLRIRVDLDAAERARYLAAQAPFEEARRVFRRASPAGSWTDFVRTLLRSPGGRDVLAGHRVARSIVSGAAGKLGVARNLLARHADDRVLLFTADNPAAYTVSRDLLVPAITCDIGRKERERILGDFRDGRIRGLVSARVLNEGLDVPDAGVGIVLGGSLGPREHVQRVGRLLRPAPGKTARVYEVVASDTFEDVDSIRRRRALAA